MPKQDPRVKEILRLIDELFGDTSVPKEQTLSWMEEIEEATNLNCHALREDIKSESKETEDES